MVTKFNKRGVRPQVHSPIRTEKTPSGRTALGHAGYERDPNSALFLLAVCYMPTEDTFHEESKVRDPRFAELVRKIAVEDRDSVQWLAGLIPWLRTGANMRHAPLVAACEAVHARLAAGLHGGNRQLVRHAIGRTDEIKETYAYWVKNFGRKVPKPVKRGLADAALDFGNEFNYAKWGESQGDAYTFADILNLTHPGDRKGSRQHRRFKGAWQRDLFGYAVKKPHQDDLPIPETLGMLTRREALLSMPVEERRSVLENPETLRRAGITWEQLAGWLQGPMDGDAWEAIIPAMSLMQLVRNLRNFDQASVSDEVAERVCARLADADEVARSRQFPFRYLAAYRHAPSLRWGYALEKAINHSLSNVSALSGRTLVLVDRSPSMWQQKMSRKSEMPWADAAAIFGAAVALRCDTADLVEFHHASRPVKFGRGDSVLKVVERFGLGDGTDIPSAVKAHLDKHDRVVIVTDEQTEPGWLPSNCSYSGGMQETRIDDLIPASTPVYMWNFGGYKHGATPSGGSNRHTLGGLADASFKLIPVLESWHDAGWPWEIREAA